MELLTQLGIDWKLFIAQVVNFLVLFILLWKLLYKPVLAAMKKREKTIEKGLSDAKAAADHVKRSESDYQAALQKARKESQDLIDNARSEASSLKQELTTEAQTKVDDMLVSAKKQIESEKQAMLLEVKKDVAQLVIAATEKVASTKLEKSDDALVSDALSSMNSSK